MRAMVLAAGVGSRLGRLTAERPKALLEVGGAPIIELVIGRLVKAGVEKIVVNAHHHADKLAAFLASKDFGAAIAVSTEDSLLDTGGGIKKAAALLDDGQPFFVHNADVLSGIDLRRLYGAHEKSGALATLAVRSRDGSRRLLFDEQGLLRGREGDAGAPQAKALGFDGIHVISPDLFAKMTETGIFSIMDAYLRLARLGENIRAFRADKYDWHDIGSRDKLERARRLAQEKGLPA